MKFHVSKHGKKLAEYNFPEALGITSISIGRSQASHIMIDDPMISRLHIEIIRLDDGNWKALKKAAIGNMLHNGKNLDEAIIKNNDILEIGDYALHVESAIHSGGVSPVIPQSILNESKVDNQEKIESLEDLISENDKTEMLSSDELEADHGITSFDDKEEDIHENNGFSDSFSEPKEESISDFSSSDNDDFSFDNDSDDDFEDVGDKTGVFTGFANFYLRLFGENIPYDRFKIPEGESFIGRNADKCQIVLKEDDVSSVHAVIKRNKVSCYLEDLNSSNGTILNGERTNRAELVNGDEFVIGSTTFTVEITSELLKDERGRFMPVEPNQVIDVEEVVEEEVNFGELPEIDAKGSSASPTESKSIFKNPKKRRILIYGAVGLFLLWMIMDDGDSGGPKKAPAKKEQTASTDGTQSPANQDPKKQFTKEQIETLEASYQVGVRFFDEEKFAQARDEFARVSSIDPTYKNVETYLRSTDNMLIELNKAEERKREEEKRRILAAEVKELLQKATESFKAENIELTQFYINKILEKDPENLEVPYLKVEVESYIARKKEEEEERRKKEEARNKMLAELKPGETFYYKREWYKAILKLEDFTRLKNMDRDLIEKAAEMLERSRRNLRMQVDPMLGEARSLKEGQDLKGAYEIYSQIYQIDPSNVDVLNEMDEIRERLTKRSMKVYREAIIAESLSLFNEAREKFQEVQQISPSDSEYYKKATEKLRQYME